MGSKNHEILILRLLLKTDFDKLEFIYKASNDIDSSKPVNYENCEVLQKKVNYLITTASKLYTNYDNLLEYIFP